MRLIGKAAWPRTLFGRFLLVFSIVLLANLVLAVFLTLGQSRAAVADALRYQLGEAAGRVIDNYQRKQVSNLTNIQWADNTNTAAGNFSGMQVAAYEPQGDVTRYDPQSGWSDPLAADQIGNRAEQVLAGRRVFWLTAQRAFLAVPERTAENRWAILLLSLPRSNAATLFVDVGRPILLTFLAVSLPTLLLAFFFFRRLTRPLSRMIQMADAVANGDFRQQTDDLANDEVGALGKALNQMAKQLAAAEGNRTLLIRGISHDLRTPLTTIKANTQALFDGIIPEAEMPSLLQDTMGEIDRLRGLVDNLLLTAGQGREWPLNRQRQDLAGLVRRTVSQMQVLARQSQQTIVASVPDTLEAWVDGRQIRQALVNLLDNAIRYSPTGGRIQVSLNEQAGQVALSVQDQGGGIPAGLQETVFEPLTKGSQSTGSGLGLYLCRRIAEAHQGSILLDSAVHCGTLVTILLPDVKG